MNAPARLEAIPSKAPSAPSGKAKRKSTANKRLQELLTLEQQAREAETLSELQFLIANETPKLLGVRQALVHSGDPAKPGWRIEKASSVTTLDRNAPLVRHLHEEIAAAVTGRRKNNVIDWQVGTPCFELRQPQSGAEYPFKQCVYFPFAGRDGRPLGGMTLLAEKQLDEPGLMIANRLSGTYAHAWHALAPAPVWRSRFLRKRVLVMALLGLAVVGAVPVPLTVLAPVEVVARDPLVVAAPLDGVIDEVIPEPNTAVSQGDLLLRYNTVDLESRLEIASRAASVSWARFQRAAQSSFGGGEGRRELAVTRAEYEIAVAERDHAAALLARAEVRAAQDGVLVFSSREEWTGKPVQTGERVMRIADPDRVRLRIDLPVSDAMILESEARVRVFLDADPLKPFDARLETSGYAAQRSEQDTMVFPLSAGVAEGTDRKIPKLRIGNRGTAQLYGQTVPLAFNLFRKPISAIRQFLGL